MENHGPCVSLLEVGRRSEALAKEHATALQTEKDEVARLKKELAQAQESRSRYEQAVTKDKNDLREQLKISEACAHWARETCEALEASKSRWQNELTRINNDMDSK